ncbi:hypothetical protein BpHYR1_002399 [Brachionus plicatilis]|uniref:Uncharacterized protein n=1 Tax=Brachionus plicatilis TaxID=10195 RepID=A0A3M7RAI5_BRAPC|nr:hypothetical protein BpHYR1_002399 [Brachionus plicatilis]
MKSFTRSSVYQGYKTVEGQLVSGDTFPTKALVYATFIQDESINLSTLSYHRWLPSKQSPQTRLL